MAPSLEHPPLRRVTIALHPSALPLMAAPGVLWLIGAALMGEALARLVVRAVSVEGTAP